MLVHRWNFLTSQQKKVYTEKAWMWIRILWHADPNPKSKNQPEKNSYKVYMENIRLFLVFKGLNFFLFNLNLNFK